MLKKLFLILLFIFCLIPSCFAVEEMTYTNHSADYTIYFADGPVNVWQTEGFVTYVQEWLDEGFSHTKLTFVFEGKGTQGSDFDYTKMDDLLDILEGYGINKIILQPHELFSGNGYQIGNNTYHTYIENLVTYYASDSRIVGLQYHGEPADTLINSSMTLLENVQWTQTKINSLHAIDSNLVIFYPYFGMCTGYAGNYSGMYQDYATLSFTYPSLIYWDITHPYYFEIYDYDMGLTPSQKADWYETNQIQPAQTYLGVSRLYCGETFFWRGKTNSYQHEWLVSIINKFVENNICFTLGWDIPYLKWDDYTENAIYESDYYPITGGSPTPTPTPTIAPSPTPFIIQTSTPTPSPSPLTQSTNETNYEGLLFVFGGASVAVVAMALFSKR